MSKVLLVDDDELFASEVRNFLTAQNYSVEMCHSGEDALQLLTAFKFDLIILDQNMPELTGSRVCKRYRDRGGLTPIIFLSGDTSTSTKAAGFDFGGDDYICKPFEPIELSARIRAILRRASQVPDYLMQCSGYKLDTAKRTITFNQIDLHLSQTETNVLEYFFRNKDTFFSAGELFKNVWPTNSESGEDAVRVLMHGLRKKFTNSNLELPIRTLKGTGYILILKRSRNC